VTYLPPAATEPRSPDSKQKPPLTRESTIGIGAGASIGMCLIIAGIVALWYRTGRKARSAAEESGAGSNVSERAELPGQDSSIGQPAQLDGHEISELGGLEKLEIGTTEEVCELPIEERSPVELAVPISIK
jgi:hypothetical protein